MGFHLVQFKLDSTLFVCSSRSIKQKKHGMYVRYGRALYKAKALLSHGKFLHLYQFLVFVYYVCMLQIPKSC